MEYYLVGGAVRDKLLEREIVERDYVVVGTTVEEMLSLGFKQVGKDFPVFLHPQTKEEFALARTEKKQGLGYTGFICNASPNVTIEQDLLRRDLTVNAMAMKANGEIIDPYQGQVDLKNRVLRHVSNAFIEDPLRVLRVARFAARYHYLGFTIAPETLDLMKHISDSGELAALSGERIWLEFAKALSEGAPDIFFVELCRCNALKSIWPEMDDALRRSHPIAAIKHIVNESESLAVRFAVLTLQLKHQSSEKALNSWELDAVNSVKKLSTTLRVPNAIKWLAISVIRHHKKVNKSFSLSAKKILALLNDLDVWRKPDSFAEFLTACHATNALEDNTKQISFLQSAVAECRKIKPQKFIEQGITGRDIRMAIDNEKLSVIEKLQSKALNKL
ncbi:tRNA nucleotidyltransferase [Thalassotalea sediminis]|uniref:tRNA nucleotidyltransferase n=1 Tax=Thalassotalea sediminis TaxID=1759089 RepID=UPI003D9B94E1